MDRIEDCIKRFPGLIDRWDVVNEATHFDRKKTQDRAPRLTAMWRATGRMEFTRACFQRARAASKEAELLINDYRTDPEYARVVAQLVDEDGKPLYDVIGLQSHMHSGPWTNRKIWEVCERFARFGVPLHFTETTLLSGEQRWEDGQPWPSTPEGERRQARDIIRFYTMLFSHPSVEAITWWDFSDHSAWKRAPAGLLRRDMTPKPVYEELHELIRETWWTKVATKTTADGTASFRGFLGDYRVTVKTEGRPPVVESFTLDRETVAPWVVRVMHTLPR
jgi:GH35 family endo-1,4-beta-xylanase